jgi:glycosyltransferase involved in cell wall biosynthesis
LIEPTPSSPLPNANPANVFVVPMGVSQEWFSPGEAGDADKLAAFGLLKDGYALCVATLEPRKNIARLLEAYSRLSASDRNRWPLVLCGQSGWVGGETQMAVAKAVERGWLRYLGFVPDPSLRALMRGARCFAFPSLYEGFGMPVLEAMACGTPVVASDIDSLREVAGDAAAYPCPTDVNSIYMALEQALCDDDWRTSTITRGLARARQFSWARTVRETISVYQHVAEEK